MKQQRSFTMPTVRCDVLGFVFCELFNPENSEKAGRSGWSEVRVESLGSSRGLLKTTPIGEVEMYMYMYVYVALNSNYIHIFIYLDTRHIFPMEKDGCFGLCNVCWFFSSVSQSKLLPSCGSNVQWFYCWGSQQTFAVFQGDGLNLNDCPWLGER